MIQSHSYYKRLILIPQKHLQPVTPLTIIFDLSGVLFKNHISTPPALGGLHAYSLTPVNPGASLTLLADCTQKGHTLLSVTNLSSSMVDFLKETPQGARLFSYFDDVICADTVGIAKPDPRIMHYLLAKHALEPRSCIFIDDQPANLHAATKVGISKTILCKDFNFLSIRQQLEVFGAL